MEAREADLLLNMSESAAVLRSCAVGKWKQDNNNNTDVIK